MRYGLDNSGSAAAAALAVNIVAKNIYVQVMFVAAANMLDRCARLISSTSHQAKHFDETHPSRGQVAVAQAAALGGSSLNASRAGFAALAQQAVASLYFLNFDWAPDFLCRLRVDCVSRGAVRSAAYSPSIDFFSAAFFSSNCVSIRRVFCGVQRRDLPLPANFRAIFASTGAGHRP